MLPREAFFAPAGFFLRGLSAWHTNPYARFPASRVVDAYLRHRQRQRPGTRWRYSNYGVAVLGHALAAATGTPWEDLVTDRVPRPLGLDGTTLRADESGLDAVGHGRDVGTPVPPSTRAASRRPVPYAPRRTTCWPSWRPICFRARHHRTSRPPCARCAAPCSAGA
ncbi:CubicO group peptidase (beta-lactamase class C family) [Streptomyces luteogriseus]|nr:CubicO group peptidase (beta-lactamase class C family) [Streptomyces luteogriseus]